MAVEDWLHEEDFEIPPVVTCRFCGVTGLIWRERSKRPGTYYLSTPAGARHQCRQANVDREINVFFKREPS